MIAFKDASTISEWVDCEPTLLEVLLYADNIWPDDYFEITRIWDPRPLELVRADGQSGIHCYRPFRAADARTKDLHPEKSDKLVEAINILNTVFTYDPDRPKMNVVMEHGPVLHAHFQVHPRTRRRIPSEGMDIA